MRTRGFRLAVARAEWDEQGQIVPHFHELVAMLHDEKPTAVRQRLSAMGRAAQGNPQLASHVSAELDRVDASRHTPSMAPLVAQDVAALRKQLA